MAMTHASKEVIFLNHLYGEVSIPHSVPIYLLVDNQSAISLTENSIFHAQLKHIAVRHHWIHEKIEKGTLKLDYIPTADQITDIFTNPLAFCEVQEGIGFDISGCALRGCVGDQCT